MQTISAAESTGMMRNAGWAAVFWLFLAVRQEMLGVEHQHADSPQPSAIELDGNIMAVTEGLSIPRS